MEQKHRNIIQKSFAYLIKNIHNVEDICDHLMSEEILTAGMVDSIKHKKPRPSGQTRELLTIIPRRGKRAYLSFLNALKETENKEIADYLDEKENDGPSKPKVPNTEKLWESKDLPGDTKENVMQHTGEGGSNNKLNSQSKPVTDWPDLSKRLEVIQSKDIKKSTEEIFKEISEKKMIYPMTGEKKGKCILISSVPKCCMGITTCQEVENCMNSEESQFKTPEPAVTQDTIQKSEHTEVESSSYCNNDQTEPASTVESMGTVNSCNSDQQEPSEGVGSLETAECDGTHKSSNDRQMEPPEIADCRRRVDFDKTSLQQLFNYMNFNTKANLLNGGTEEEIKKFLEGEVKGDEGYDSLVVIFLSGGMNYEPGEIYDVNSKLIERENILDILRKSEGFKGKPKLVLIRTYSFEDKTKDGSLDVLDAQKCNLELPTPNTDDLFVVSSRPKTKVPWIRGKEMNGSYFVQAFVHVFKNHAHDKSFMEMMEEVNSCLFTAMVPAGENDQTGQKTNVANVLVLEYCKNRELYFFPGLVSSVPGWPVLKTGTSLANRKELKNSTWMFHDHLKESGRVFYPLVGKKKGKLLLICNINCPTTCCGEEAKQKTPDEIAREEKRRNTLRSHVDMDISNCSNFLKMVGFEHKNDQIKNKKGKDVKEFLENKIKAIDEDREASHDCLVVAILSGKIGCEATKIYDVDGDIISKNEIFDILKKSKHFEGKPKLVIIQTYNFKEKVDVQTNDQLDGSERNLKFSAEPNSDDLFVVSSYLRNEKGPWMIGNNMSGSYFIQAFIHVFKNHAHNKSLLEMMEEVNSCLANAVVPELGKDGIYDEDNTSRKKVADIVILEYCKKKDLYFFPFLPNKSDFTKSLTGNPIGQPSA